MTERKQAAAALEQAQEDLERRVEERTEQLRRTNEQLRGEEEKLREILENSPMGVAITTRNSDGVHIAGERLFVNSALVRMFGGSDRESFIKASIDDSWVDLDQLATVEKTFKDGGDLVDFEVHRRRMDGATWWVSMNTRHIQFDGQDCTMIWHFDITERKRVEKALRESEERYRELFDESPVAIWVEDWSLIKQMLDDLARRDVKDWRGYFNGHRDQLKTAYDLAEAIEISRATIELYGKESKEHLLQMSTAALVIDEELDAFREMLLSFLAGRMTVDIEAKDTVGDGSQIMVRRRVVVPPKYHGDWSRVIFAIEDISERTRLEEQLRQAQKMEAVGQLTGGIAHDFNNLLGIILGNAEMLSERIGESDSQIQALLRATSRGAELTQRLLAFSRNQPLQPKAIDVGALTSGMVEILRRSLGAEIEIRVATAGNLWTATADPGLLENALLNLAINARDAISGEGRLVIETGNTTLDEAYAAKHDDVAPGDYVVLSVTDNGSGMTPEVLARVFEPFYTTKEVGKGSGLGLSMVYGFAKQSGGHIAIYSEEGKGTTVKLYLPRTEATAVSATLRVDETPRGRGETVLVVEDHDDIRELAVLLLDGLGYQVLEAGDGAAALDVFDRGQPIDLLLTDMVLPGGMSGRDLAGEAERRLGSLKVLFMTGYSAEAVQLNGWVDKGADLLNKPFRRHELATKVRAVLDRATGISKGP